MLLGFTGNCWLIPFSIHELALLCLVQVLEFGAVEPLDVSILLERSFIGSIKLLNPKALKALDPLSPISPINPITPKPLKPNP